MSLLRKASFRAQLKKVDCHSVTSWHRELEITKALKIAHEDENKEDEARAGLRGGPKGLGPQATHQKEIKGATHQINQIAPIEKCVC